MCSDVESEPIEQLLWALKGEIVFFFDQSSDEIGQTTVRKGDVAGTLKNSDVGPGVETTETGRRRHPTGDAADDHDTACSNIGCVATWTFNDHDNPDMDDSYGLAFVSRGTDQHFDNRLTFCLNSSTGALLSLQKSQDGRVFFRIENHEIDEKRPHGSCGKWPKALPQPLQLVRVLSFKPHQLRDQIREGRR